MGWWSEQWARWTPVAAGWSVGRFQPVNFGPGRWLLVAPPPRLWARGLRIGLSVDQIPYDTVREQTPPQRQNRAPLTVRSFVQQSLRKGSPSGLQPRLTQQ